MFTKVNAREQTTKTRTGKHPVDPLVWKSLVTWSTVVFVESGGGEGGAGFWLWWVEYKAIVVGKAQRRADELQRANKCRDVRTEIK